MELVKSSCSYGTGIIRDLREWNVQRWKPVPEDWLRTADREDSVCV
jgi:hypothetical protein